MGASCVHGRVASFVGAFYAPRAGEGNQILPINSSKSVETIRGYTLDAIPVAQQSLMTTLQIFLAVTLVIVLAPAIIGIAHVKQLENLGWPLWLVYITTAWLAGAPVWVVLVAARSTS
jgi:hypothetical protein